MLLAQFWKSFTQIRKKRGPGIDPWGTIYVKDAVWCFIVSYENWSFLVIENSGWLKNARIDHFSIRIFLFTVRRIKFSERHGEGHLRATFKRLHLVTYRYVIDGWIYFCEVIFCLSLRDYKISFKCSKISFLFLTFLMLSFLNLQFSINRLRKPYIIILFEIGHRYSLLDQEKELPRNFIVSTIMYCDETNQK